MFYYDVDKKECHYCFLKHGAPCLRCRYDRCLACSGPYFLRGESCKSCAAQYDGACTNCNADACTECMQGYYLVLFDVCYKNVF